MSRSPDVLMLLDRLLAITPETSAFCRPLPRGLVESIADEIRTLRAAKVASNVHQTTTEASNGANH